MLDKMKNTRVVIEGPDGVGKTAIAKALAEDLSINYFKFKAEVTMFSGDPIDRLAMLKWGTHEQLSVIEQCNIDVVMDRFLPSEAVYSRVYGRSTEQKFLIRYGSWWRQLGGVYVFLDKPTVLKEQWDDELIAFEKYQELRVEYDKFMAETIVPFMKIDTTECDTKKTIKMIKAWLRSFESR